MYALAFAKLHLQGGDNLLRDLILELKHIAEPPVVTLGPQMVPGGRINELRGDAHLVRRRAHAAFHHVPDAELPSHLLHLHRFVFVGESRGARHHLPPGLLGESRGELFGEAVTHMLFLGVIAEVDKSSYESWPQLQCY
jgi:hypothetical protein